MKQAVVPCPEDTVSVHRLCEYGIRTNPLLSITVPGFRQAYNTYDAYGTDDGHDSYFW